MSSRNKDNFHVNKTEYSNIHTNTTSILDINKDLLLEQLWINATNNYNIHNQKFNIVAAKHQLHQSGYADYICGRPIKCNIYNTDDVYPILYNRDNGDNKFEDVIYNIKNDIKNDSVTDPKTDDDINNIDMYQVFAIVKEIMG